MVKNLKKVVDSKLAFLYTVITDDNYLDWRETMMQKTVKITFTTFVVALIVLPLPPSTIIGLIIANHPKTNKYMVPQAVKASEVAVGVVIKAVTWKVNFLATGREKSAKTRIENRTVYL